MAADRTVGLLEVVAGDPEIVESLFLASATAPLTTGLVAVEERRLEVADALAGPVALVVVLEVTGLAVGFGLEVLADVASFRTLVVDGTALVRFSATVVAFVGE